MGGTAYVRARSVSTNPDGTLKRDLRHDERRRPTRPALRDARRTRRPTPARPHGTGVGGDDEVLTQDPPITTYPVGVLFPRPSTEEAEEEFAAVRAEDDGLDDVPVQRRLDVEDHGPDLGVALATNRRPSSMGLTFAVDPALSPTILVTTEAAAYDPIDPQGRPISAKRAEARSTSDQSEHWRRRPLALRPVTIDVTRTGMFRPDPLGDGVELRALVRPPSGPDATVTVTVTLINEKRVGEHELQDAFSLYQPRLTVTCPNGERAFVERPATRGPVDPEQGASRLLHRYAPTFAMGHGCAADWDWTPAPVGAPPAERSAVAALRTEFVPTHDVLLTDSNPEIDDSALTMQGLASGADSDVLGALDDLLTGYERWIGSKAKEVDTLKGTSFEAPAREQVKQCRQALVRMRSGVQVLRDEPDALKAFRLANLAMARQRARGEWIRNGHVGSPDDSAGRWRPFQVSFMLLCLEGIVDPTHPDHEIADLLWFPTGGGKTEAYLGLIAFITFLRRMRLKERGAGVTVLMRYTLRLLTLQQFERATALICAMERIRIEHVATLGTEPISIGMWVGQSATPNKLSVAAASLTDLRGGKALQEKTPSNSTPVPGVAPASTRTSTRWTRRPVGCTSAAPTVPVTSATASPSISWTRSCMTPVPHW